MKLNLGEDTNLWINQNRRLWRRLDAHLSEDLSFRLRPRMGAVNSSSIRNGVVSLAWGFARRTT